MITKLTAKNQTACILDDIKHYSDRDRPHYGFMAHVLMLSRRIDALAQGMETRQGGDGTAPPRSDDSPVGTADAPNPNPESPAQPLRVA